MSATLALCGSTVVIAPLKPPSAVVSETFQRTLPAGTPDDIVQKLRAAARKVAADPTVVAVINKAGSPIEYLDAPEFQAYWDADSKLMTDAVRRIGKVE